jgi:hypothetical protein
MKIMSTALVMVAIGKLLLLLLLLSTIIIIIIMQDAGGGWSYWGWTKRTGGLVHG